MVFPVPPQAEQVCTEVIVPKMDCFTTRSCPVPLQRRQVSAWVPGFAPVPPQVSHLSMTLTEMSFLVPKIASSNVI